MRYRNIINLYPKSGRIINSVGNYNFTETINLDLKTYSNGYIYLDFLKTLIPSVYNVKEANLYLHISNIGGTTSNKYNITLDVYSASTAVSSSDNIEQVRALKDKFLGSYDFKSDSVSNEKIKIDITDYVNDYIYGNNDDYGILIEPKIKDLSSMSEFSAAIDEENSRVFLIGGNVSFLLSTQTVPDYNMEVYIYDFDQNKLSRVNTKNRPRGRGSMVSAIYDNFLYIYGGEKYSNSGTYYKDLWRLNLENYSWEQVSVDNANGEPGYIRNGEMVINQDGLMFIIYGQNESGINKKRIWTLDLTQNLLMWEEAIPKFTDPLYEKSASRDFTIVKDERSGHEYDYYIIGGNPSSSYIYKIKLDSIIPTWLSRGNIGIVADNAWNSSATFYKGFIYYFIGNTANGAQNILYKISPDNFGTEELDFIGEKPDERYGLKAFMNSSDFYIINGYIDSWETLRNSSNIWYTDLSQLVNRNWVEAYNQRDTYNNNANTIRVSPVSSYDSSYGEKQGPFIQLDYEYDTQHKVRGRKISSVINKDAYIAKESPTTNFGTNNYVIAKESDEESGVEDRALFGLNLDTLPASIDILSAILYIPRTSTSAQRGNQARMEVIKEDWGENEVNWFERKDGVSWGTTGGVFSNVWSSYNLKIDNNKNQYDITRILQQITGSFNSSSISNFGIAIYNQDIIFDSRELNNSSYLYISYIDKTEKELGKVVLNTPNSGSSLTSTPTFKFKAPYTLNNERLHFRLELSQDISFSTNNITSFSTSDSITGWSWDVDGDDSGYVDFPNIGISGYISDTSLIKFDMSVANSVLENGTWFWRVFVGS